MTQAHMSMPGMGGPVGGAAMAQNMNAGTPNNMNNIITPDVMMKKLNTAIYEYFLIVGKYDVARLVAKNMPIETADQIKQSPSQQGHQANGIDNGVDADNKEHVNIAKRPEDLPAPNPLHNEDSSFLQDWWLQFWEIYYGNRRNGRPNTLSYIGAQRQAQKSRHTLMAQAAEMQRYQTAAAAGMVPNDLRQAALKKGNMGPVALQQMRQQQAMQAQQQGQQMQGTPMERQGSAMDMNAARNGSPHSGDAPSPKRQKTVEAMNQLNRPGQPGPMNVNQGMPPNGALGPGGAQASPMGGASMGDGNNDFYNGAAGRIAMQQNGAMTAAQPGANGGSGGGGGGGNHALQDYQMQLMLLEQQNKKRLLMARQEQDSMTHAGGMPGGNGGRGSPTPAMMDGGAMNPAMQRMVMGANGQPVLRPPSSHPMAPAGLTPQQQMEMFRQNGVVPPGGPWTGGNPAQQGQMMPGQQPGQQPGQPLNMTPRAGNMAPPPAPQNGNPSGGPSSPAQPPAPPTPSTTAKAKPTAKKDTKAGKAAAKKNAAAAANEDNPPPTPTPPPPVTPSAPQPFNQTKNMALQNGQGQNLNNPNNQQPNGALQGPPEMGGFADLSGAEQYGNMTSLEFAELGSDNVLESFDFDSFLNTGDGNDFGIDASMMFGDGGIETEGIGN